MRSFLKLLNISNLITKSKSKPVNLKVLTYSDGITIQDSDNRYLVIFKYESENGFYLCTQSIVKEFYVGHTYAPLTINRFKDAGLTINYK